MFRGIPNNNVLPTLLIRRRTSNEKVLNKNRVIGLPQKGCLLPVINAFISNDKHICTILCTQSVP